MLVRRCRLPGVAALAAAAAVAAAPARAQVKADKTACYDQPDCDRLSNGTVEVVMPTALGPRIARYGFWSFLLHVIFSP